METYSQEDTAFPFQAILGLASVFETSFNADSRCPHCRNSVLIPDNHDASRWKQASPALSINNDFGFQYRLYQLASICDFF
jgi:hypothetical protein